MEETSPFGQRCVCIGHFGGIRKTSDEFRTLEELDEVILIMTIHDTSQTASQLFPTIFFRFLLMKQKCDTERPTNRPTELKGLYICVLRVLISSQFLPFLLLFNKKKICVTDRPTNRPTDGRTPSYRDA